MSKSIFKSKTAWFNVLTIVITVATMYGFTPNQELTDKVAALMVVLSPVINLILRFVTKKPVHVVPEEV
jgi:ABC-type uncharacterized transport system permease subunit